MEAGRLHPLQRQKMGGEEGGGDPDSVRGLENVDKIKRPK